MPAPTRPAGRRPGSATRFNDLQRQRRRLMPARTRHGRQRAGSPTSTPAREPYPRSNADRIALTRLTHQHPSARTLSPLQRRPDGADPLAYLAGGGTV